MRRARVVGSLLIALLLAVACTLNPQPLPPEGAAPSNGDAPRDAAGSSGDFAEVDAAPSSAPEAGVNPLADAGTDDAGNEGDAGDAGDASDSDDGGE